MLFLISIHLQKRRIAWFRNSLTNGQGLADEEGMRITTNRDNCLRVVGWEGEFTSSTDTADNRRERCPNATCFSNIGGISEVERGWGLSLEKERRKARWLQKGGEHPNAAQYSGSTA